MRVANIHKITTNFEISQKREENYDGGGGVRDVEDMRGEGGGCEVSARRNKQQQGEQAPSPTPSSQYFLSYFNIS